MHHTFTLLLLFPSIVLSIAQSGSASSFNVKANQGAYNQIGSVVAPVKMNVLYIGVDNPLDIAVPGIAARDITANITNGTIKKTSDGHFIADVTSVGKALVIVNVKNKEVSRHEFRVKRIPDPNITINSFPYKSRTIRADSLRGMTGISPLLQNFDFDAQFKIQRFQFVFESEGKKQSMPCASEIFTPAMRDLLKKAKAGDTLIIDDVFVMGPDTIGRKLGKLVYVVN